MKIKPLLTGILSYIPGLYNRFALGTGGTNTASYCYGVWIKHLTLLGQNGMHDLPQTVAELGPGDSLGIGLAALLSGVNEYYAFDVVKHTNIEKNLKIFDDLVALFDARAGTPDKDGFPDIKPYLDSNLFPGDILTETRLVKALDKQRVESIRQAILNLDVADYVGSHGIKIRYMVPWNESGVLKENSVDLIYSQAVLEHVSDLEEAYRVMAHWLKPDGFMSHQIDFRSHGLTEQWNGHWACSDFVWKIVQGRKPYLINRQPHSMHLALLKKNGFEIKSDLKFVDKNGIGRTDLCNAWRDMAADDLYCSGALIQSVH